MKSHLNTVRIESDTFNKEDLLEVFDLYYENLKGFLFYKTGDIDLAEDMIQDIFLKVWEKKREIEISKVKGLLFTIGGNLVVDYYRHSKMVLHRQNEVNPRDHQWEFITPEFLIEEKEFKETLEKILASLPDGCREVFLMHRIDKLSYDEIASSLGLSVKAIEKRISKAIKIVKNQLGYKI